MLTDISSRHDLIRILPFGGVEEIGMNLLALEHRDCILLIDCGLKFTATEGCGSDIALPDTTWLQQHRERICAIIITHGHEDHTGALPFVLEKLGNPAVYATAFTLEMIRARLLRTGRSIAADMMHLIQPRTLFTCGPFRIEAFNVAHSIPGGVGLAINTAAGCIIHSGDFKLDPSPVDGITTDLATLGRYADTGVLALLADSTNIEHPGFSASERDLIPAFDSILHQSTANVFISTFSSNIHRIQTIIEAAQKNVRKVVLLGRGLNENVNIAHSLGLLRVEPHTIIRADEYTDTSIQGQKMCIIASGCQGEPGSAMRRIAAGDDPHFRIHPGDRVIISARTIPGNEIQINTLLNQIYSLGAKVYTGAHTSVHVSGHACAAELRQLTALVKPRFFIPVHGEPRHLAQHANLASECGIPAQNTLVLQNGAGVVLSHNGAKHDPGLPCSPQYIDMHNGLELETASIRERKRMGRDGCVHISVYSAAIHSETSGWASTIHLSGINHRSAHSELKAQLRTIAEQSAAHLLSRSGIPEENVATDTCVHKQLEAEIFARSARVCKKILGYRPHIILETRCR
jgi:ribonuclease J